MFFFLISSCETKYCGFSLMLCIKHPSCNAYILPIIDYFCSVWGRGSNRHTNKVFNLQKRIAKIILKKSTKTHSVEHFKGLNLLIDVSIIQLSLFIKLWIIWYHHTWQIWYIFLKIKLISCDQYQIRILFWKIYLVPIVWRTHSL